MRSTPPFSENQTPFWVRRWPGRVYTAGGGSSAGVDDLAGVENALRVKQRLYLPEQPVVVFTHHVGDELPRSRPSPCSCSGCRRISSPVGQFRPAPVGTGHFPWWFSVINHRLHVELASTRVGVHGVPQAMLLQQGFQFLNIIGQHLHIHGAVFNQIDRLRIANDIADQAQAAFRTSHTMRVSAP